jgi:hypothetical protein
MRRAVDFGCPPTIVNCHPHFLKSWEGNIHLELHFQWLPMSLCAIYEYTNSSIAWRIEFYNSYFVQISTKKGDFREVWVQNWQSNQTCFFAVFDWTLAISEKFGFRIDNPIRPVSLQFLIEQGVFNWQWPAFLESRSHQLRINTKMSPELCICFCIVTSIVSGTKDQQPNLITCTLDRT